MVEAPKSPPIRELLEGVGFDTSIIDSQTMETIEEKLNEEVIFFKSGRKKTQLE